MTSFSYQLYHANPIKITTPTRRVATYQTMTCGGMREIRIRSRWRSKREERRERKRGEIWNEEECEGKKTGSDGSARMKRRTPTLTKICLPVW